MVILIDATTDEPVDILIRRAIELCESELHIAQSFRKIAVQLGCQLAVNRNDKEIANCNRRLTILKKQL